MCMFCRSLFVLLYFFFWPLYCLSFFDIRIMITPLVSSKSSMIYQWFIRVTSCRHVHIRATGIRQLFQLSNICLGRKFSTLIYQLIIFLKNNHPIFLLLLRSSQIIAWDRMSYNIIQSGVDMMAVCDDLVMIK